MCDSWWRAERLVEFYAQPVDPEFANDPANWGGETLTNRTVKENDHYVVRGYSAAALRELSP